MANADQVPGVLIVDDRRDKLVALEAVLSDLGLRIVTAGSGREALKRLLTEEFAVVLLDVQMPGMDGFETATLIRQRKNLEHTPIIFITAYGDDMHVAHGYRLGAVDFILSPIVPEILRTKVMVFIDLYRKSSELLAHAEQWRRRALQLHKLNEASLVINSALGMDELLRLVAERAVDIFSARRVAIIATVGLGRPQTCKVVAPAVSDRETAEPNVLELEWVLSAEHDRIVELRAGETYDRYLEFEGIEVSDRASGNPKLSIAPLFGRDGQKVGTMAMLVDDDPLDDCSPLFLQLAQTASIAIENTLFADAREANRLKDEFLATLSHELRTPLTAMFGWIQLLRTGDLEPAQTEQGLEVIERNITVQAKLIDDLLDISRIVSGKLRLRPAPMDLRTSVRAAVDVIRPQSEAKGLHLEVVEGDQPATVYGDADRLQQVAWNLLSNAVKFTPQDGHIRVDITESHRQVRLRISDTGQGITASFLPHVFDRFRQADSTTTRLHEGLGIGLALVEHVVHLHGGTVKAESPGENQGATFTVELPVSTDRVLDVEGTPPANDERISDSSSALRLTGLRVLVVEDQQDTREVLVRTIENYGADVLQADCAAQAIELLQMHSVDLLVSDIGLPRMDGYGLIRCLRRDPTMLSLPAIAVTAFAHDEDRQRALRAGYDAHVAKPVSGSHLARTALQLLQSRRAVDDAAAKNGTKQTSVVSGFHRQ